MKEEKEEKKIWGAVHGLRRSHADLATRLAAHEARHEALVSELRAYRLDGQRQMEKIEGRFSILDEKLDTITAKVSEAHGAAHFGKWAIGILIACGSLFFTLMRK